MRPAKSWRFTPQRESRRLTRTASWSAEGRALKGRSFEGGKRAFAATDWSVIVLLAAILPLGAALERTGLDGLLGGGIAALGSRWGAWTMLSLFYAVTSVLTAVFSNTATAVLMVPIGISAAEGLGVDMKPFLMATAFATSCDFSTPMGYQTNAMVLGPGSYRFVDYLKFGIPLNLAFWALASVLIPVFWRL